MFPILGTNVCPSVRAGEKQIPGSATIIVPDLKKKKLWWRTLSSTICLVPWAKHGDINDFWHNSLKFDTSQP